MKKLLIIHAILLYSTMSCEAQGEAYWKEFSVRPDFGRGHACTPTIIQKHSGSSYYCAVQFDSTCIYDLKSNDQLDWNKLIGLYNPNKGIHVHSFRFGWRWLNDSLEISYLIYLPELPQPIRKKICSVEIGKVIDLKIDDLGNYVVFKVNGFVQWIEKSEPQCNEWFIDRLYFGGNKPTPHTISVMYFEKFPKTTIL